MPFPVDVTTQAMVKCGRCCCLCHKFCGSKMECHHIVPAGDSGGDDIDNCIPLCFDCHQEVGAYNAKHPKGRRFTPEELKGHRDNWYKKVSNTQRQESNQDLLSVDREVFRELRGLLTYDGSISLISEHDFAGPFDAEELAQLKRFVHWGSSPEHEFLDADLEQYRSTLLANSRTFLSVVSANTWQTEKGPHFTVPPEWRDTQADRFSGVVRQIHASAAEVFSAYCTLIRMGRRKLAVT